MPRIDRLLPRYLSVFSSYLLADDDLTRERALDKADELGKSLLLDGPALDQLVELHGRAQRQLAQRWRSAAAGTPELAAVQLLAEGDATPLLLALMLSHDLAQQAQHERRWLHAHGQGAALFEQTDDMIVVLGKDGQVESVNPAYTRQTGWSPLEAATRFETMFPATPSLHHTQILRSRQKRRDGSEFTVEWSISPIRTRSGELLSHVCIGRDVTHQQQVADGLRENDKLRAVATLAAGVAHDFNNLLGSINGLAELCALEAPAGSRQERNLGRIRQAGEKAAALVRQMLDFSRQTPNSMQRLPLGELLMRSEGLLRAAMPQHVALTASIEDDGPVLIDLVQMEQVLLNMTRNAAQAMGAAGGHVRIIVDRAEPARLPVDAEASGHLRLRIIDTGNGIPPDVLPKIFDPFFTTKPVGEGTGLGLAAVHGIVSSHGGVIEVDSEVGSGTVFSVFLPLADQVSPSEAEVQAEA